MYLVDQMEMQGSLKSSYKFVDKHFFDGDRFLIRIWKCLGPLDETVTYYQIILILPVSQWKWP